jgi:hypothetical protein
MGQAREHDRFPGPLFLSSLGLVGARSLANYTERPHTKCRDESAALNGLVLSRSSGWLAPFSTLGPWPAVLAEGVPAIDCDLAQFGSRVQERKVFDPLCLTCPGR